MSTTMKASVHLGPIQRELGYAQEHQLRRGQDVVEHTEVDVFS